MWGVCWNFFSMDKFKLFQQRSPLFIVIIFVMVDWRCENVDSSIILLFIFAGLGSIEDSCRIGLLAIGWLIWGHQNASLNKKIEEQIEFIMSKFQVIKAQEGVRIIGWCIDRRSSFEYALDIWLCGACTILRVVS